MKEAIALFGLVITLFAVGISIDSYRTAQAAAPADPEVTCVLWADTKPWAITRCQDEYTGEVCFLASSGFLVCRFE